MASGKQNAIFIGYRREDTQDTAGRIYDRLVAAFGEKAVFKDVDNLPIGADFGAHILALLPRCRVFLALIGPGWLDARDQTGARRIDDPGDWVRIELETAFATPGLQIVPVLVNGARMPRGDELPESLRRLTRFNAASVRRDPDFSTDMARMVEALRASVTSGVLDLASLGKAEPARAAAARSERNRSGLMFAGGIAAALALVALGYGAWRFLGPPASSPASTVVAEEGASSPLAGEGREGGDGGVPAGDGAARTPTPGPAPQGGGGEQVRPPPVQTQQPQAPPQQQQPPPQAQSQARAPAALPEMVRIPGGSFVMGSPPDEPNRDSDEGPQRTVQVAAFSMPRTEVTFAQWDACADDGGCNGYRPADQGWGRGSRPVINVSWQDAQAYVQWLSAETGQRYRLPSEAEWEYAARAGTTTAYSTGASISTSQANFSNNLGRTQTVGAYPANRFGLNDMHGNVWEWVEDCYSANYDATRDCSYRVNRGGSWYSTAQYLRSGNRGRNTLSDRDDHLGFLVARTN